MSYANLGDSGVMILRHVNSSRAGSASGRAAAAAGGASSSLQISFLSQQQLHSFNRPYQLGYDDPALYTKVKALAACFFGGRAGSAGRR